MLHACKSGLGKGECQQSRCHAVTRPRVETCLGGMTAIAFITLSLLSLLCCATSRRSYSATKQLSELLASKEAEKELLAAEIQADPVKVALKNFAAEKASADLRVEGIATAEKMKMVIGNEIFRSLNASEFKLLAKLCTASSRKIELPAVVEALAVEIKSIESARDKTELAEVRTKRGVKDEKAKESAKRKLEAASSAAGKRTVHRGNREVSG